MCMSAPKVPEPPAIPAPPIPAPPPARTAQRMSNPQAGGMTDTGMLRRTGKRALTIPKSTGVNY